MDTVVDKIMETPRVQEIIKITDKLDDNKVNRVLDIGCGNGYLTERIFMKKFNAEFFGIDMGDGVEVAKKKGIITYKADLNRENKLKFKEDFFDLILAGEIIEHLVDPDKFLEEIHRILKDEGTLILSCPNLAAWYNRILLLIGYQPFWTDFSFKYPFVGKIVRYEGDGQHLRVPTYKAIKELLEIHKFNIEIIKGTYAADMKLISAFKLLEKIFWKIPSLSSDLVFVCKKNSE